MRRFVICCFLVGTFAVVGHAQSKSKKHKRNVSKINSEIRNVDFKNFTYNATGDWCVSPVLRNGHAKYGESDYDTADLSTVKYVDFDGDGKEEAFVIISWSTSGSAGGGIDAFVFAYRNGSAQQIWSKCNERSSAVLSGRSVLFTYPEYVGDDAHCCPTYATTDTYGWKGSGITRISKRRKRN